MTSVLRPAPLDLPHGVPLAPIVAERYDLNPQWLDRIRPLVLEIRELDNGGEPCTLCQLENHVVELQVYGTDITDGELVERECCRGCMATAVRDLDDITIELVRG